MKYQIHKKKNLPYFLISLSGNFCLQSLEKCYTQIFKNPGWKPSTDIIWDARLCSFNKMKIEDVDLISVMAQKYTDKRGGGVAAWIIEDDRDFDKSFKFQMLTESKVVFDFRIFRSIENAILFLSNKFNVKSSSVPSPSCL